MNLNRFTQLVLALSFVLALSACDDRRASPNPTTAAADNTARNERDKNDATLTPDDQGGSEADRALTAKVRKALMDQKDYSTTAKNIKIITLDGKVTLRGPVATDAEKTGITGLAKGVAGDANVDDQLEVKAKP